MTENNEQNGVNQEAGQASPDARMAAMLAAFRQVGMPLLQTMAEVEASQKGGEGGGADQAQFNALVDGAVKLSQELAKEIGAEEKTLESAVRWALVGSSAQVVAASYRATGKPVAEEEIKRLARIAAQLQETFITQIPAGASSPPNTVATFRAKMMEAMVPVIGAVAQYSFGRAEHELLAEVSQRLVKMADQVTRTLAEAGSTPEEWRLLCWNVLRAAGQIYTECHYAEADRLLYMDPDARAAYFAEHGSNIPMVQVWQAFNQRMAMLATLATYLEVPASAGLEEQSW